jgi:homoserine kinase
VRAFAVYASPADWTFEWTSAIPRERGLGSSAAVVALGLVAGAWAAGVEPSVEELLEAGLLLEGHADNLAAALAGGVCLTWDGRVARIADGLPARPIAVIPETRVSTAEARRTLPHSVTHADARFTVARAALLGASIASGDAQLFAASHDDRLHEPYRPSPLLDGIRAALPRGAIGATLSGSGPTVIVWAEDTEACARELEQRFPDETVMSLGVSPEGAH